MTGSAAEAILAPRNGALDLTSPVSRTTVESPSATTFCPAETSTGALAAEGLMVFVREPSAAGALQDSSRVTVKVASRPSCNPVRPRRGHPDRVEATGRTAAFSR